MDKLFFTVSNDALATISKLYDLIHPLRVSLSYTRKRVQKIQDINLAKAEIDPTGEIHGVNFQKVFVDDKREDQEEDLAWILLNSLFAIHEGWGSSMYEIFRGATFNKEYVFTKNLAKENLADLFSSYFVTTTERSSLIDSNFQNAYFLGLKFDYTILDKYMLLYRYFKELRNCFMHHGSIVTDKVVQAYNDYTLVVTCATDLDVSELPVINSPVLGERARISMRGVIGFSQIIRRIIMISDINLLLSKHAENEIIERGKNNNWKPQKINHLDCDQKKVFDSYFQKNGMQVPADSIQFRELLLAANMFYY